MSANGALLEIRKLCVAFRTPRGPLEAVRKVDLDVRRGEICAIIGESGSGKSATALAVLRLHDLSVTSVSGDIIFDGRDLGSYLPGELRALRGGRIGMVFQEPMASWNPVFTVGYQIDEAVRAHRAHVGRQEARLRTLALLRAAHLEDPARIAASYPHQLSGGMRQRAMIAMALANGPELLIADEPTTALDVTLQRGILDLLKELNEKRGMSILLITHDFGVVSAVADRVFVMRRGEIVEAGDPDDLLSAPREPYTKELVGAASRLGHASS